MALDTMQNNRVKFDVKSLFKKTKGQVSEMYRECRKVLPHIDAVLTERLKTQTSVTASLVQALFSELKAVLRVDKSKAAGKLDSIERKADIMEDLIVNLVEGHLTERVVLYLMLACTLIVSMGSIWCMRWAMQESRKGVEW